MASFQKNAQTADIIIHVDENIDAKEEGAILSELRKMDGVMSPDFNTPHLIVVKYNPERVNSFDLLTTVRAEGYHAQLLGI